jgi:hypothetical protein
VTVTGAQITRTLTAHDETDPGVADGALNINTAGPPAKEIFPFPSPFNPSQQNITFRFRLSEAKSAEVIVTDLFGQEVWRQDVSGNIGFNDIRWDGSNDKGVRVAAGVYYVLLNVDGSHESTKRFGVIK